MEGNYTNAMNNVMCNFILPKRFSDCSISTKYERLHLFQIFLSWLSKEDEAEMLKMYMSKPRNQHYIVELFPQSPLSQVLRNIQECYSNTDVGNKSIVLSLVSNQFKHAQLQKLNFKFSEKLHKKSKAIAESKDFKIKKRVFERRNYLKDDILIQLLTFLINHSKCSKKEHVKINQKIPDDCYTKASYNPRLVYTSELSKLDLFAEFIREHPKLMSRASFYRYFPCNLKTPTK